MIPFAAHSQLLETLAIGIILRICLKLVNLNNGVLFAEQFLPDAV